MKLALFFTEGVSMQIWDKVGMLDREIKPYNILAENFEKIYFITYGDERVLEYKKFLHENIEILPKKSKLPSKIYSLFLSFIFKKELSQCDIFKTNQMQGAWSAVIAKILYRKKLVVRCGYQWSQSAIGWKLGFFKKLLVALIERICYLAADKVILTTEPAKAYIEEKYDIRKDKIEVISNYVDADIFRPASGCQKIPGSVIYVGRLENDKNIRALVEAFVGLDASLDIFGEGSLRSDLGDYAEKNHLRIAFHGNIQNRNLPEQMNLRELLVLPSHYEGNPKVLLEAMACGMAVIGANVRGINNIIIDGENGILCANDSDSLREAIRRALNDDKFLIRLGINARQYVLKNCTLEKCVQKEIGVYNFLIKKI